MDGDLRIARHGCVALYSDGYRVKVWEKWKCQYVSDLLSNSSLELSLESMRIHVEKLRSSVDT